MLRLRFASQVPDHAVNVAFVETPDLGVHSNVALLDMSYKRVENLSAYVDGELNVDLQNNNRVDTDEIVPSSRSVLSRGLIRPIPLFYKYAIGRGNFSVVVQPSNPADLNEARYEMLKQFQILDRNNNKITGPAWDVEVTGRDSNGNYIANLYLDYRQNSAETFKLRYQAADYATGANYPNHIEVINAVPALQAGVNYNLNPASDGGYYIAIAGGWVSSDGIGLFYTGIYASKQARLTGPISIFLPAAALEMELDAGGTLSISLSGKSIQDVVEEINNKNIEWTAAPMIDNPSCLMAKVSWVAVTKYGRAFKQHNVTRVRYLEETRVSPLLPYKDLQYMPWYPRVDLGQFSQDGELLGANCKFLFKPQGSEVTLPPGQDGIKYDRLDEKPVILAPKILKLHRPNLDPSSLVVTYGERELSGIIEDYDELNSVLFLNREFGDISKLFISYSYYEGSVIYTGVDLNPLGPHSPSLLGKFIGLYMTPAEITGPVPPLPSNPVTIDRTLFHIVGESMADIEAKVSAVQFDTSDDAKALLLGIYRVGQAATIDEVQVTDTRSEGGGLKGIEEPSKATGAEETDMFWDFSLWDGEPFPPTAVVIDYPSELLGTGEPLIEYDQALRVADPSGFCYPSGQLTPQQIQSKMDRYKAGGVIAIINPEDSLNG